MVVVFVVFSSWIGYNLGLINSTSKAQISVGENAAILNGLKATPDAPGLKTFTAGKNTGVTPPSRDMRVVVSKASDSKKYHYSWCASRNKIKPENAR